MSRRAQTVMTFAITLKVPDGANGQTLQQYIRDAISTWKGGLPVGDPMSGLDTSELTVSLLKRTTTYE